MKNRKLTFLFSYFLIFASFVFTGCASLPPSTQRLSAEQNICPDSPLTASLEELSKRLKTMKGTALVKMQLQDGRETAGRAVVIVKRPDRFRFEILGPFNQISIIVVYNGNSVSLLSLQENKIYKDYIFPIDVSRLPNYLVGLPAGEISGKGAGAGILNQDSAIHPLQTNPCYVDSGDEQILINSQGSIKEIVFSGTSQPSYPLQVSMDDYKEVAEFNFPGTISISNKGSNIFIKYEHIELNHDISDDLFILPQEPGKEDVIPAPSKP